MTHAFKWKRPMLAAVIGLTVLTLTPSLSAQATATDPHTSYIGSNYGSYNSKTPSANMLWSQKIDQAPQGYYLSDGVIAAGGGKIFAIKQGQLLGINVQSGATAWKYGAKLKAPLLYQDGVVYVSSEDGTLYAVDAASGKGRWKSAVKSPDIKKMIIDQDQVFVFNGHLVAYGLKDGGFQWRDYADSVLLGTFSVQGDLVFAKGSESGAYTIDVLYALDRKTGKQRWKSLQHDLPIAYDSKTVVSQRTATLMDFLPLPTVDTIDINSGKVIKTIEYNPANLDEKAANQQLTSGGKVWITGNQIYIRGNHSLYNYPANADPDKVKKEYYSAESNMDYAAGPYDGRVLFTNGTSVYGIKTANKSLVTYGGLGGVPIARFDLLGHGMYVAKTDGSLTAINLITAAPIVEIRLNSMSFGPTLLESGVIIVQGERDLVAFREPAALRLK